METGPIQPTGAQEGAQAHHRRDWEENHAAIRKVILEGLAGDGMPSNAEIAERSNLSLATVKAHLATLKQETAARFDRYKFLTDEVLMGMYRAGKGGDGRAGKIWFQFVEEWEERKKLTTVAQNPYSSLSDEQLRKRLAARRTGTPVTPPAAGEGNAIPPI